MFQEVPIRLEQKIDHPMYKAAIRDAMAIINNETEKARADREREMLAGNMYNMGMLHGFQRILGLLEATIQEEGKQ